MSDSKSLARKIWEWLDSEALDLPSSASLNYPEQHIIDVIEEMINDA